MKVDVKQQVSLSPGSLPLSAEIFAPPRGLSTKASQQQSKKGRSKTSVHGRLWHDGTSMPIN